jgi:secernin
VCDTLVALGRASASGAVLFAKNSDRERNEAQLVELIPAAAHAEGSVLQATYIALPQVRRTHACLISRPFWMWGAEMGANARGVVIGNEAVHAKIPAARRRALTGMDLVRLALERAAGAAEAVEVITSLLERHGQGGDCGHLGRFYYHNSFLIADRSEAFVLETVGRHWALEPVATTRAISNALSIGAGAARVSDSLASLARSQGWRDRDGRFDFAGRLIDEDRDAVSRGRERCARGQALLAAGAPRLTTAAMMAILRDHGASAAGDRAWTPAAIEGRTICMHAGPGGRRSQTTGSLVSELSADGDLHWVTATAAPCLSLFKPVRLESGLPPHGPAPSDRTDADSLWWRHERLHRRALADYAAAVASLSGERDRLEDAFRTRMDEARAAGAGPAGWRAAVGECWREAQAAEARWLAALTPAAAGNSAHARSWRRLDRAAGLSLRA